MNIYICINIDVVNMENDESISKEVVGNDITNAIILSPKSDDVINCIDNINICIINCNKPNQCLWIQLISKAKQTIINCNNIYSCKYANILIESINKQAIFALIECKGIKSCSNINIVI